MRSESEFSLCKFLVGLCGTVVLCRNCLLLEDTRGQGWPAAFTTTILACWPLAAGRVGARLRPGGRPRRPHALCRSPRHMLSPKVSLPCICDAPAVAYSLRVLPDAYTDTDMQ